MCGPFCASGQHINHPYTERLYCMNETKSTNWGSESLHVLGIIGAVLFRIFSYFMNILLTVLLICLITGVIVGSVFAIYINNYLDLEIDPSSIVRINRDSTTRLYYMDYETEEDRINREGTAVEIEDQLLYAGENTLAVEYSQLPDDLVNAFISIEDHRFRSHNGVDWVTTIRAVGKFVFGGDGGGSTITQQLIKNVTGDDEYSIQRKVQEIFRALNLEKVKSKEEILEAYMNIIYLGNNCYGVQAAANYYFGKDVSELDLVECAALASIVKNPSQYEPKYHDKDREVERNGEMITLEGNESRRWVVLDQMNEYGYITESECKAAQDTELVVVSHEEEEEETAVDGMTIYTWYTEAVLTQLTKDLMEKYSVDKYTASLMIYNNGYKIVTCMDPEIQGILEEVYVNDTEYFPSTGTGLQPQSAMVVCDPYTGDVLGTIGGRGPKNLNRGLDRATVSTRPPGSSIKPLSVYAPALDAGLITYGSVVDDTPVEFYTYLYQPATEWSAAVYSYAPYPKNLPEIYRGLTTINSAVTRSVNTVAMKVLQMYTVDRSFDFMKQKLHFDSLIDSYTTSTGEVLTDRGLAALSLGQPNYGVTVLEMTAAYCMFQNSGVYNEPNLYTLVTDGEGKTIIDKRIGNPQVVISDASASIMTKLLENVMTQGTGTSCTLREVVDVAGKTGTTSADFDRTFLGYTPYYVAGVWTGYDMPQSLSAFGQNPSLTVWDIVMTKIHQKFIDEAAAGGEQLKKFELAPGVIKATYCKDSGKLCTDSCRLDPRGYREETGYFTRETAPTEYCDTHVTVLRDASTGLIACPECYSGNCYSTSLIRVEDRSFPIEIYVEDAQYVYREMPSWVKPSGWWGVPFFVNMLETGEYCGSSYVTTPYNAYCYLHCDYRPWGGNGPAQYSGGGTSTDTEETETETTVDETTEGETTPDLEEPVEEYEPDDTSDDWSDYEDDYSEDYDDDVDDWAAFFMGEP